MWRTVRIRQKEYEFVRELAKEEKKSMCEVVSEIVAERMNAGENKLKHKNFSFYFKVRIGSLRIFRSVKVQATAIGLLKLALKLFITYFESIVKDEELTAEEKIEKIKAALSAWDVRGEKGDEKAESILEMARRWRRNETQNP